MITSARGRKRKASPSPSRSAAARTHPVDDDDVDDDDGQGRGLPPASDAQDTAVAASGPSDDSDNALFTATLAARRGVDSLRVQTALLEAPQRQHPSYGQVQLYHVTPSTAASYASQSLSDGYNQGFFTPTLPHLALPHPPEDASVEEPEHANDNDEYTATTTTTTTPAAFTIPDELTGVPRETLEQLMGTANDLVAAAVSTTTTTAATSYHNDNDNLHKSHAEARDDENRNANLSHWQTTTMARPRHGVSTQHPSPNHHDDDYDGAVTHAPLVSSSSSTRRPLSHLRMPGFVPIRALAHQEDLHSLAIAAIGSVPLSPTTSTPPRSLLSPLALSSGQKRKQRKPMPSLDDLDDQAVAMPHIHLDPKDLPAHVRRSDTSSSSSSESGGTPQKAAATNTKETKKKPRSR